MLDSVFVGNSLESFSVGFRVVHNGRVKGQHVSVVGVDESYVWSSFALIHAKALLELDGGGRR